MMAGQQVTPTIRLSRMLGQGGMGSVWIADHLALGTQVAVKFMSPSFAHHPGFVERFRREAMAAAQIKSPHVAQVFDHGITADGMPYIVMELLEGEDLKTRIQRLGPLSPAEVTHIVAHASKALGRAHALGIIHRDIKPDNLFILEIEGELFVKVLDFGVAKFAVEGALSMTLTGSMMGTPLYMSPEQLLSTKNVDLRADLWALAVVTYFALTGRIPFTGDTVGALAVVINAGIFAPPSAVRIDLPLAIDTWMHKALQRDPAARFTSARELSDALALAAGVAVRGNMLSMQVATCAPALDMISSEVGGGSKMPDDTELEDSKAQGRSLAAMSATGREGSRRRLLTMKGALTIAGIATIITCVFLITRRVPEDPSAHAAIATHSPELEGSASSVRTGLTITPAGSLSVSAADTIVSPETSAHTPPVITNITASTHAAAPTVPAATTPARPAGAPKAGPLSKPAPIKDTVGF